MNAWNKIKLETVEAIKKELAGSSGFSYCHNNGIDYLRDYGIEIQVYPEGPIKLVMYSDMFEESEIQHCCCQGGQERHTK